MAIKHDKDKLQYHLLPETLDEVAKAFMVGALKYGEYEWMRTDDSTSFSRWYSALYRHATAWWQGEDYDPVDGQHHLGSVCACALILMYYQRYNMAKDNRPNGNKTTNTSD
jgi:hypothetical protein